MQTDSLERLERVLDLARARLPLDEIATGPADELGLGPGYAPHRALDFVFQELRRFPGRGWDLLKVGLMSPVVRNRHMVVNALDAWGQTNWPADAPAGLDRTLKDEPVDKVQERLESLLGGEPLS